MGSDTTYSRAPPADDASEYVVSDPTYAPVPTLAIVALAIAAFGAAAGTRVTDPMLPVLARDFGVGIGAAASVVTLFTGAYGVFQLVYGPIGDRFGKYRVIAWASAASAITTLACALAPTFPLLVAARFLAGGTAAAIIPLSMAWIGDTVAYEQRQPVLARFLTGQMMGFAAGSLLGALGAEHLGYRTPFVMLAAWQALASAILFGLRRRSRVADPVTAHGFTAREFVAGIAYVWRRPWARVILVTVFLEGTFMFGAFAFIATHLHRHYDVSLTVAGSIVMLYGVGGIVFAASSPLLVRRLGEVGLAIAGGGIIFVTLVTLAMVTAWPVAALATIAMGMGFYMLHNTLQTNATQMAPERRGTAVSQFAASLFIGQSVGVALAGLVAETIDTDAVLLAGAAGVLAVALGFAYRRRHRAGAGKVSP
ncbi:MAG: MFS transporter [Betaproteobacteria bacterium]